MGEEAGVMGEDTMEVPMEGITAIPKQVLTTLEGAIFQEIMFQVLTQDVIHVIEG